MRSHDGRHATGTTDFELYISMFVPQSSSCFPLCLSLHGTCRALAQMYILVTHMIALQLPFHLTVGPLAPYKSCVSHPCIARACIDCDPTIWYFVFFFHRRDGSKRTDGHTRNGRRQRKKRKLDEGKEGQMTKPNEDMAHVKRDIMEALKKSDEKWNATQKRPRKE